MSAELDKEEKLEILRDLIRFRESPDCPEEDKSYLSRRIIEVTRSLGGLKKKDER